MPTVVEVKGYRLFSFSNEALKDPHIHVEQQGRYAKFWLKPVVLDRSQGFAEKELVTIRRILEENEDLLREKWLEHFGRQT